VRVLLSYQNVLTAWQVLILNCFLFIREEEEDDDNDHGLNDDNDSDEELDEEAEEQRILQPGQFNANLNLPEEEEPEDIPDEEEDGEDDTPVVNTPPRPKSGSSKKTFIWKLGRVSWGHATLVLVLS